MGIEIYEVDEKIMKNIEEEIAKLESEGESENSFDEFKTDKNKDKFDNLITSLSKSVANDKAELEMVQKHKKDVVEMEKSKKKTIANKLQYAQRNIMAYCDGDEELARKIAKGKFNFKKSEVTNMPQNIDEITSCEFRIEAIDNETGEVTDITKDVVTISVNINKTELKGMLKDNKQINIVDSEGEEHQVVLKDNLTISTPKVIR